MVEIALLGPGILARERMYSPLYVLPSEETKRQRWKTGDDPASFCKVLERVNYGQKSDAHSGLL